MRDILNSDDPRAKLAFEIYAHRLCREIGGMAGVLGGADAIVFTGGIGENCPPLRDIVKRTAFVPECQDFGDTCRGRVGNGARMLSPAW